MGHGGYCVQVHNAYTVHTRRFFMIWIGSKIFCNFIDIIRFIFSLAFQRRILNCSTSKTREALTKRMQKVEDDGEGGGGV